MQDKQELVKKIEQKGMTVAQAAEAMEFNPVILHLYLAKDPYPVPQRILDKLSKVLEN
jgi:hypothetical protein